MRTTIKLRIRDVSDAELFIEKLKDWLEEQETNVSLQIGQERWKHFGKPRRREEPENNAIQGSV